MNSFKTILTSITISILCAILVVLGYNKWLTPKIGYIRSGVILQEYKGMVDATSKFNKEMEAAQVNADTLRRRYEAVKGREGNVSAKDKKDWSYQMGVAKNEYDKYQDQFYKQMEQRKAQLSQSVLSEINTYIQDYGKKNHYRFIFGTTNEGSILYGKEDVDLTETILKDLNAKYKK